MGNCLRIPPANMVPELREHGTVEASTSSRMPHSENTASVSQERSAVEASTGSQIADMRLSSLERPARRSSGRRTQSTAHTSSQSKSDERPQSMLRRAIALDDQWRSLQDRCAGKDIASWQARNLDILKEMIVRNKEALECIRDGGGDIDERSLEKIDSQLRRFEENIRNNKKLESHLAKATALVVRLEHVQSELSSRSDGNALLDDINSHIAGLKVIASELEEIDNQGAGIEYDGSQANHIAHLDLLATSLEMMLGSQDPGYYDYLQPAVAVFLKDGYYPSRQ